MAGATAWSRLQGRGGAVTCASQQKKLDEQKVLELEAKAGGKLAKLMQFFNGNAS